MKKILIFTNRAPDKTEGYVKALELVGLNPERGYTETNFDDFDGLLVPGGPDIDPYFYGEENYASKNTDFDFDRETLKCIEAFEKANKPIVGICLGQQFMNVYFKGTLIQDIKKHGIKETDRHLVHFEKGSIFEKIYGESTMTNSLHHQCIKRLADDLLAVGKTEDGVIEAVQHKTKPIIAVQWHPEKMLDDGGIKVFEYYKSMFEA